MNGDFDQLREDIRSMRQEAILADIHLNGRDDAQALRELVTLERLAEDARQRTHRLAAAVHARIRRRRDAEVDLPPSPGDVNLSDLPSTVVPSQRRQQTREERPDARPAR